MPPSVTEKPRTRRSKDGSLTMTVAPDGDACVLRLAGELGLNSAPMLEMEVYGFFDAGAGSMTLDLKRLKVIDSMGEQCLLSAVRWSRRSGGELRLVGAKDQVQQALKLTGVRPLLPFVD
jgi:anti-sigma B factor antagonist